MFAMLNQIRSEYDNAFTPSMAVCNARLPGDDLPCARPLIRSVFASQPSCARIRASLHESSKPAPRVHVRQMTMRMHLGAEQPTSHIWGLGLLVGCRRALTDPAYRFHFLMGWLGAEYHSVFVPRFEECFEKTTKAGV